MVRAVGHWSNTTSLGVQQCSNWRNGSSHSVWESKDWEHRWGKPKPASAWHRVSVLPYQTEIFVTYRQTEI